MRQRDLPYVGLLALGHAPVATLYAVLVEDALTRHPYRTNTDLGRLIGVGPKRVTQCFAKLECYGLARIEARGSKRAFLLDCVPNDQFVGDVLFLFGALGAGYDPAQFSPSPSHLGTVTKLLLSNAAAIPLPRFSSTAPGHVLGYVSQCPDTFDWWDQAGVSAYGAEVVHHDELALSVPALKPVQAKPKRAAVPDDVSTWGSFALMKRLSPQELALRDTSYFVAVTALVDTWNQAMGQHVAWQREHYVQVRSLLKEGQLTQAEVESALWAYARDPFFGKKATGFDQFFNKPVRVRDFLAKSQLHDRFARNLPTTDKYQPVEIQEDGTYTF